MEAECLAQTISIPTQFRVAQIRILSVLYVDGCLLLSMFEAHYRAIPFRRSHPSVIQCA